MPPMHTWALKDNPSAATVDWSFMRDSEYQAILAGAWHALLDQNAGSDRLR